MNYAALAIHIYQAFAILVRHFLLVSGHFAEAQCVIKQQWPLEHGFRVSFLGILTRFLK